MKSGTPSFEKSAEFFERISKFVPSGVHSSFRYYEPNPVYFKKAKGARIWDLDDNEFIDCIVNNGALILGHADQRVKDAVVAQLETGLTTSLETELSFKVAKQICEMVPCAEATKFSVTGTEAVAHAIEISRAFTSKKKILRCEGSYHGWFDGQSRSGPYSLEVPFNDIQAFEKILLANKEDLAAVIMEPVAYNMGCVLPLNGYLNSVRELTERHGIVLIFDEVISGFRIAPGGAQQHYNVKPDLATFAKAIANGFPLSAVAGRKEIMATTSVTSGKAPYSGTYNGNQVCLAAADATLNILKTGDVQRKLMNNSTEIINFSNSLNTPKAKKQGFQALGIGGQFHFLFTQRHPVQNYEDSMTTNVDAYLDFRGKILENGVFIYPHKIFHHGITDKHESHEIDSIKQAIARSIS